MCKRLLREKLPGGPTSPPRGCKSQVLTDLAWVFSLKAVCREGLMLTDLGPLLLFTLRNIVCDVSNI